jgi:hypothetical protein
MRRALFTVALGFSLCLVPALNAQRGGGIELHGVPASVTSPTVDGRLRGIPGSVTTGSFIPATSGRHHHEHSRDVRTLYAEPYYGYYVPYSDYDPSQQTQQPPAQPAAEEDAGSAQPDDSSRYGKHYFDDREPQPAELEPAAPAQTKTAAAKEDDSPATTLVYRDGHKSEVRNYAIVGSNLIDLTKSPVLKKIPLESLDLVATRKQNEDNGVDFHTP